MLPNVFSPGPLFSNLNQRLVNPSKVSEFWMFLQGAYG